MVHGYIHKKGNGNELVKITIPVETKITGFLLFNTGDKELLSFYDVDGERFFIYDGYTSSATMLNRFNSFSGTLGKVKEILGRAVYRNTNISNDTVNFIYFCLTDKNKIVKVVLKYNVIADSYSITNTATISLDENKTYNSEDILLKVFKHTDQYDLVTHDPAYVVCDKLSRKLYLYTVGISETHLYEYEWKNEIDDPLYSENMISEFPNISPAMETKYINECPIIIHDSTRKLDKIVYVDFVNNIISRTSFVQNLPYYFDNSLNINGFATSLTNFGDTYKVAVATDKNNEHNVTSYIIDLKNRDCKILKQTDLENLKKNPLSVNLFFNGGDYIRNGKDKIKILVRDYKPSLRYPNKSVILAKALSNTNIGFLVNSEKEKEETTIPRIFENENAIEELKEKDTAEVKFANDFSRNKLLNSIIGNKEFMGLISDLNSLEENTSDYESVYTKSNKLVKLIKANNNIFDSLLYLAKNSTEEGFDISLHSSVNLWNNGAISLENVDILEGNNIGKFVVEQGSGTSQNISDNYIPVFISGNEYLKGYGLLNIDNHIKIIHFALTKDTLELTGNSRSNASNRFVDEEKINDLVNEKILIDNAAETREIIKSISEDFSQTEESDLIIDRESNFSEDGTRFNSAQEQIE